MFRNINGYVFVGIWSTFYLMPKFPGSTLENLNSLKNQKLRQV